MKNFLRSAVLLSLVAFVGVAGGCAKKPQTAPAVKPTPAPEATPVPTTVTNEREEFKPQPAEPTEKPLPGDVNAINKAGYLKDVFFDFDKYDIRPDQRDALAADAEWLKKYATIRFRIEGHCDERGTAQYNLALGDRRANAAKEYLVSLGVDASRIETISYGKERPFAAGHDEAAWAQNRRGHFVVTAK